MKSNRQARHILGMDYKISNQKKVVIKNDNETIVSNRHGRHRRAE